jgi:phage shock protein A
MLVGAQRQHMAQNGERLKTLCDEQQSAHQQMRLREHQLKTDIARLQRDMAHLHLTKMKVSVNVGHTHTLTRAQDTTTGVFVGTSESESIITDLRRQLDEAQEHIARITEDKLTVERRNAEQLDVAERHMREDISKMCVHIIHS